ncbi:MAG TPA: outer membrane beta-barrel protein [Candidatus Acidoferrales bacterium]|nr:outer membrane beta-barrel protein [Candidatus Acidoferrales bacterium]
MKKLMWAAVALSFLAVTSQAQDTPKADVAVGYSFLHATGANLNGFNGSVAFNVSSVVGIVGDIGYYHGSPSGTSINASSYTFGPRFSYRKMDRAVPFFEALFGGSHVSAAFGGFSGSVNPFAYAFGGGVDLGISHSGKVGLRPEYDYIGLRSNGATLNTQRLSVGIVFHIGSK